MSVIVAVVPSTTADGIVGDPHPKKRASEGQIINQRFISVSERLIDARCLGGESV
jgi:hypothetical protein